jgi:Tfp pilus assembly protein PilF
VNKKRLFLEIAFVLTFLVVVSSPSWPAPPDGLFDTDEIAINLEAGATFLGAGDLEMARAAFSRVLELDPENYAAAHDLAFVFQALSRNDEAIRYFEEASSIRPLDAEPHLALGSIAFLEGKTDVAMKHFEDALKAEPENIDARFDIAIVHLSANRPEEAQEILAALASENKGEADIDVMLKLAEAELATGALDESLATLDLLEKSFVSSQRPGLFQGHEPAAVEYAVEMSFLRGCLFERRSEHEKADAEFEKARDEAAAVSSASSESRVSNSKNALLELLEEKIATFKKTGSTPSSRVAPRAGRPVGRRVK